MTRLGAYWSWDAVKIILDGITHDGRLWNNGAVDTKCGISCREGIVHPVSVREIDCMSCLVKQARGEVSSE